MNSRAEKLLDLSECIFGNITGDYFLSKLLTGDTLTNCEIITSAGGIHIRIDVFTNKHADDIKKTLKKLSKHSRVYNFTLVKMYKIAENSWTFSTGRPVVSYIIECHKNEKTKKPNPPEPTLFSIKTIENMLGFPKKNYTSIVHKVCNNGDRYIFNSSSEFFENDVEEYIEELKIKMQKILNKYGCYVKIFCDYDANMNVIVTNKKNYYKDNVPVITKQHIFNILGVNEYNYNSCYINNVPNDTYISFDNIADCVYDTQYTPLQIWEKLNMVFGNYYIFTLVEKPNDNGFIIRFVKKPDAQLEFIKLLDNGIAQQLYAPLSPKFNDRIETLKNVAKMTLEERCAAYKPPIYPNENLNVSQQLSSLNKLLNNMVSL